MIAIMSVSFLLIGLVMLIAVAFLIGLGVLVAIVTKRPGVVAIVGLAMLLMVGVVLVSLVGIRSVSHSNVHSPPGINTFPEVHHDFTIAHSESLGSSPMPQSVDGTTLIPPIIDGAREAWPSVPTISTPTGGSSSGSTHFRAKFVMFPVFLVCGAVVAVIVAAISRRKSSNWWPAILIVPGLALLALSFFGWFGFRVTREFSGVPQFETLHQDFGHEHAASSHAEVMHASQFDANQARMNAAHVAHVEELNNLSLASANQMGQSLYIAAAMNAQMQRQFATMDINQLIAMFETPKIELSAEAPELPIAPSPPVAAAPVAAATVSKTTEVVAEAESTEKAVEPLSDKDGKPVASANREAKHLPEWADDQPGMHGDDWREVIATDEYATAEECRRATDIYLMLKTAERMQTLAGYSFVNHDRPSITFHQGMIMADGTIIYSGGAATYWNEDRLQLLQRIGIGIDEIRRSVVREQHLASRDSARALDTMYKQYTHAQFTPWFDSQLRRHWDAYRRSERFAVVGVGAGSVLGLLAFVFGLLKVDTLTKGYYTKRLFLGVPAMIIGGILLLSFFVEVLT